MSAAIAAALFERGMTETIIGRAFVAVLENVVGLVDFLELVFAILVARVAIGMPLHGELAERGLKLTFVGGTLDFQGFVIAAFGRCHA